MLPPILDATCGSRMIWFDKNNPNALFMDCREEDNVLIWKSKKNDDAAYLNVHPDVIADFTAMPFPDESFYLVVFDPPHLDHVGETAWLCRKYGKLNPGWEQMIHDGFAECMRVLKPYGTLIFKWSDIQIPVRKVIEAIGQTPLFGNRSGKADKKIWMTFMKEGVTNGS